MNGIIGFETASTPRPLLGKPFLEVQAVLRSVDGPKLDLRAPDNGATVVVFFSTHGPASVEALADLVPFGRAFPRNRLMFVGVCVDPDLTSDDVASWARERGVGFPLAHDPLGDAARRFGAKSTPEAFVLVGEGRLCYQGRLGGLRKSIDAVLAGNEPSASFREAAGSPLPTFAAVSTTPNYTNDVEPILRRSCQACHQPGQAAPFPLTSYARAARWARDLADVTERRFHAPLEAGVGRRASFAARPDAASL